MSIALFAVGFAFAPAAPADPTPTSQPQPADALASKQQMVRDRVSQLVDRMYRLSEALAETEPENAEKLRTALNETKQRLIELNADRAVEQLRTGRLDDATATQEQLLADLNDVLKVVLAQPENDEERRSEIERLERQREELNRLIDEQQQHVEATQKAAANAARAEAIKQAAEAVGRMLEQQQGLSEQTQSAAEGREAAPAEQQQALSEEAKQAAEDVGKLAEETEAAEDGTESAEAPEDAAKRASEALEDASKAMSKAAGSMSEGDAASARDEQADAEEELRRALHELEKEEERLKEESDAAKMAESQRETQGKTQRLAEDMSGQGGQPQQGGEQEGGEQQQGGQQQGGEQQEGQQQSEQQQPSPGTDRVQQAQRDMGEGAEKLEQERMEEAEEKQQEALDELQQARRELEQSLDQLRREEQLDALANLQERLQAILTRQKRVNEVTTELNDKPAQSWERADELKLAEVVEAQKTNLDETRQTLHILEEDATTVAFPSVIEQVAEDMDAVVQRLTDRKLGALTQRIEGDIVETLEELLAAIERQQSEMQEGQQPGQQPGDQQPPLIPTSAELKLLKQSQVRVNRRTSVIAEVGQEDTDAATREARVLSDRQQELADLAREMQSRMSGEAP